MFKSKKIVSSMISSFFTPKARLAFIKLRQVFVRALIFYFCDLERHIRITKNASGYKIGKVFN